MRHDSFWFCISMSLSLLFANPSLGQRLKATLKGHSNLVHSLQFTSDGKTLMSAAKDGTIRIWDVKTRKLKTTINYALSPKKKGRGVAAGPVGFHSDGKTLVALTLFVDDDGTTTHQIKSWDVTKQKSTTILRLTGLHWNEVCFCSDGKTVALAARRALAGVWDTQPPPTRPIRLWDVETKIQKTTLKRPSGNLASLRFSPDGKSLASVGRTVHVWEVSTGNLRFEFEWKTLLTSNVRFSPDQRILAVTGWSLDPQIGTDSGGVKTAVKGKVALWDVLKRKHLGILRGSTCGTCLSFRPNRQILATANHLSETQLIGPGQPKLKLSPERITLWDVATLKPKVTLKGPDQGVHRLAFSPDGKTLAAAVTHQDPKTKRKAVYIRLWDVSKVK